MIKILLICFAIYVGLSSEIISQQSIAVTIYNDNFAMVKDVRKIRFDAGESFLYFTDVSENIQTQTVTFKPLQNAASVKIFEQNFEKNLINKFQILQKYIEKEIQIYVVLGQMTRRIKGTLLGYNSGFIIQTPDGGVSIFNDVSGMNLPSLPSGFFTKPTLNWKIYSNKNFVSNCQLAYRTTGFTWKADYSLVLNADESLADVGGWVTIDNNSGKKYSNAKIKLIAGEVNTVQDNVQPLFRGGLVAFNAVSAAPSFEQKSFGDYHLYTLSAPVTLNQSSQKQIEFIPKAFKVPLRKFHLVSISSGGYNQEKIQVQNKIQLTNSEEQNLGFPLPKGIFRVFKQDQSDGSLQFIGQDSITHTPIDQKIFLTTGNAFDIVANKIAIKRQQFENGEYSAQLELKISNTKQSKVQIEVIFQNYYGDNLKLLFADPKKNNILFKKTNANQYRWNIFLNKNQQVKINWAQSYRK